MALKQYNADVSLDREEETMDPMDALRADSKGQELPPRIKAEAEGYKTLLTKLMHSKETRANTMKMLKSGPPQMSVPMAADALHGQAEDIMKNQGIEVSNTTKLLGSVYLVSDLVELGNYGAEWDTQVDEMEAKKIYQDTLQDYVEKGVKNKTLDPIDLQQKAEPLMTDQQRAMGTQFAQEQGVPMQPNQQQIIGNQRGMLQGRQGGNQ